MIKIVLSLVVLVLCAAGCSAGERPASPPAVSGRDATPPANDQPTPTSTGVPHPAATPISEVLPVIRPPEPTPTVPPPPPPPPPTATPVRGGTDLPVPAGTGVAWGGCASDGTCHSYNFYWAPTHQAVLQNGEPPVKVRHELCHAHQHWAINGGAALDPLDYDLESWYSTSEGQSFSSAVSGLPWPWSHSAVTGLEDFAWTCAYWYLDPARLLEVSPPRYQWAAANLP